MKVVVVGGVAGGMSAAARLRRLDESADIVVLERDNYVSFANCGLPYHIGGDITDRDALLLQTPTSLRETLALDVRTGHEVLAIDRAAKSVTVRDIEANRQYTESYDRLVLATGATPLRPPTAGYRPPAGSARCAISPTWTRSSTSSTRTRRPRSWWVAATSASRWSRPCGIVGSRSSWSRHSTR